MFGGKVSSFFTTEDKAGLALLPYCYLFFYFFIYFIYSFIYLFIYLFIFLLLLYIFLCINRSATGKFAPILPVSQAIILAVGKIEKKLSL